MSASAFLILCALVLIAPHIRQPAAAILALTCVGWAALASLFAFVAAVVG